MSVASDKPNTDCGCSYTGVPSSSADIDRSCGVPVLFLFLGALKCLVISGLLGALAAIKLVYPDFWSTCGWVTYGRLVPAAENLLVYGGLVQGFLGVLLWLIARNCRAYLQLGWVATIGAVGYNAALIIGFLEILSGNSTGYRLMEFPLSAAGLLLASFAMIAISAFQTVAKRNEETLYVSTVYAIAALFLFPWFYATAYLLVKVSPVRGVLQAVVNGWFTNYLEFVWLGLAGLATLLYFVPKLRKGTLYSEGLALVAFWALLFFGSLAAMPTSGPVPTWIVAVSNVGRGLSLIAIVATLFNVYGSCGGSPGDWLKDRTLKFHFFAVISFAFAGFAFAWLARRSVGASLHFTFVEVAVRQLWLQGFCALSLFGAIYFAAPKLLCKDGFCGVMLNVHFFLYVGGLVLLVAGLVMSGLTQGKGMPNANLPVIEVVRLLKGSLMISLAGAVLMLAGSSAAIVNFLTASWVGFKNCCLAHKLTDLAGGKTEVKR